MMASLPPQRRMRYRDRFFTLYPPRSLSKYVCTTVLKSGSAYLFSFSGIVIVVQSTNPLRGGGGGGN